MPGESKLDGRKTALALVNRINGNKPAEPAPISFDDLTEAIDRLAESRPDVSEPLAAIAEALSNLKHEAADLSPIVKALAALEISSTTEIDLSAVVQAIESKKTAVDLSTVEKELKAIRVALEQSNNVTLQLVKAAKASKQVIYDSAGRIVEIKIKS